MFRKKCQNCGSEIAKNSNFCQNCGAQTKKQEDFGMLGKNDFQQDDFFQMPKGVNFLVKSLIKSLDKQFKDLDKQMANENSNFSPIKRNGISISISTSPGKQPNIKINNLEKQPKNFQKKQVKKQVKKLPKSIVKIGNLPKKEPTTNVRRLSDRVIYEINIPGVNSINNVSINQLENNIEIKAITKDKAYIKLIPLNLPILDYNFEKGKLVLELENID